MLEMRKGTIETRMTPLQIIIVTCLYFVALLIVIYFTRAPRGALWGLCRRSSRRAFWDGSDLLWQRIRAVARADCLDAVLPLAVLLRLTITVTPIYLVTWRVVRRFGWRGLAVCLGIVAIIGPPRDYLYALKFRRGWCSRGDSTDHRRRPGLYRYRRIGHGVMTLVAGPSRADRFTELIFQSGALARPSGRAQS